MLVDLGHPSGLKPKKLRTLDFKVVQDCLLQPLFAERWLRQVARRLRELLAAEGKSSQCRISVERMEDRGDAKMLANANGGRDI